ncbi:multicopper oxidase domain-containing protein [Geothermobacter hydrogeniphilus]|uniref:Multicopper oxidase n=1 Tax=Geothermobacter hydrogeniphilus TaxID=1969733 RepID=A0A1X0XIS8_9BACT|nr:multicopper oxidase domain-containing protein [Geothermobacter hydrogeniphilus]ORJ52819.1 hypothetical protein B5V00_16650 [Geothermobacter hydrogeniphilus]
MSCKRFLTVLPLIALLLLVGVGSSQAVYRQQCPPDTDGVDTDGDGIVDNDNICVQIGGGDGYAVMGDGRHLYTFGFSAFGGPYTPDDVVNGTAPDPADAGNMWSDATNPGLVLGANFPAPTMHFKQGQKVFLTLHNVGMLIRPDLFDPHTVHYHGFPNVAAIFDGLPDSAVSINMGSSMTYFYNLVEPGTYMYHCHVEATEHMQMGMLGNFYVDPIQDNGSPITVNGKPYSKFAYNDINGATGYDVMMPLQIHSFDPVFHTEDETVQPLSFSTMRDVYPMFNGRGYPDTVNELTPTANPGDIDLILNKEGNFAQGMPALIKATAGDRVLLRVTSLSTTEHFTVISPSIPMKVVGNGAQIMRTNGDPTGTDLFYMTNSIRLGGGEATDVILDTTGVAPGTYFVYSRNLEQLSNNQEDFGGMMTEIIIQ